MENNKNGGALFNNNKKEKPSQPDYTGIGEFNGVKFKISGWINVSKAGKKYQRLIFTEIVEQLKENLNDKTIQQEEVMPPISEDHFTYMSKDELSTDLPF